eukprot:8723018-Lingulodinium_polyedra.AAC.1
MARVSFFGNPRFVSARMASRQAIPGPLYDACASFSCRVCPRDVPSSAAVALHISPAIGRRLFGR